MKTGIELIAEERQEQIVKHGFNAEHDDQYNMELRDASVYLLTGNPSYFPSDWSVEWKLKFDSKGYKEQLIVAGALIASEIDRLQRMMA